MNKKQQLYWKVMTTDREKEALTQFAKTEQMKTSEALRHLVRHALRDYGLWPPQGKEIASDHNR